MDHTWDRINAKGFGRQQINLVLIDILHGRIIIQWPHGIITGDKLIQLNFTSLNACTTRPVFGELICCSHVVSRAIIYNQ